MLIGHSNSPKYLKQPNIMAHAVVSSNDVLPEFTRSPTTWRATDHATCTGSSAAFLAYLRKRLIYRFHSDPMEFNGFSFSNWPIACLPKPLCNMAQGAPRITQCHPAALPLGTAPQPRRYRVEPSACKLGFTIPFGDNRSTSGHGVL